jgi:septal ring factor EnvC (AmiA/AmiB activator)
MDELLLRAVAGIGTLLLAGAVLAQTLRNQPLTLYSLGIAIAAVFLGAAAAGSKVDFSYADGAVTAKLEQIERKVAEQQAVVTQVQEQESEQSNRIEGLQQKVVSVQSAVEPIKSAVAVNQTKVNALESKIDPLIMAQRNSDQRLTEVSRALNTWADSIKVGPDNKLQVIDQNKVKRSLDTLRKPTVAPQ